jgi:hypothetical protein
LGFEDTNSTMGILDYMKKFNRINTIQVGVWVGSNGVIRISGTQSMSRNNYKHEKMRHSKRKDNSADGNGRR